MTESDSSNSNNDEKIKNSFSVNHDLEKFYDQDENEERRLSENDFKLPSIRIDYANLHDLFLKEDATECDLSDAVCFNKNQYYLD